MLDPTRHDWPQLQVAPLTGQRRTQPLPQLGVTVGVGSLAGGAGGVYLQKCQDGWGKCFVN